MELGSYQTAWAMLHRYRSVMVRPGRDRLHGDGEVDESHLGGPTPGIPGRGALGQGAVRRGARGRRARLRAGTTRDNPRRERNQPGRVPRCQRRARQQGDPTAGRPYPPATRDRYVHVGTSVAASSTGARGLACSSPSVLAREAVGHGYFARVGQLRAPPVVLRASGCFGSTDVTPEVAPCSSTPSYDRPSMGHR